MAGLLNQQVLKEGAQEERGENARLQYFVGAMAVGDMIKTTLGPKGQDKILVPFGTEGAARDKAVVTNDGATILSKIWLDNPAAQILVDLSRTQDKVVGDGTTGVVVLAAEILREAEKLVDQKVHPQIVCAGLREALDAAREALEQAAFVSDEAALRSHLLNLARTTLSSKLLNMEKELFSELAVDAVLRLRGDSNLDLIQVIKKVGGSLHDSYLDEGFILEKKLSTGHPKVVENCRVLIANTSMDADKIKIYGAQVKVDSFEAVAAIESAEREKHKQKVDKILKHNINVFVNRQLIYNYPDQLLREGGVLAIEHADFDGIERLSKVLGGDVVSTFDDAGHVSIGECQRIEEIIIGEDKVLRFSGCKRNEACSIVIRGSNQHLLDEAERSLHDALAVLSQVGNSFVLGGGAAEMAMAEAVDCRAREIQGKKSLAIEAVARALRQIPTILLDNGGYDSADVVARLRALHHLGQHVMGADIQNGQPGDMQAMGVLEAYKSKLAQICAATEAAEMLIRCDEIIRCAPRRRQGY
ncbi:MAG: uncharacterized protein KVP18_003507 [Porospora cf. gigantea A]|uniref:uncharacterized protein n=2 Tax=Porospora cf. gigantea A TaxID=2853593 RepID=UPI003559F8BD|nr:MAG: hypothetical protein KVP18_003507 [Porospora cf. gigantea A]